MIANVDNRAAPSVVGAALDPARGAGNYLGAAEEDALFIPHLQLQPGFFQLGRVFVADTALQMKETFLEVDARQVDGLVGLELEIDDIAQRLQDGGTESIAAGTAQGP